VFVKNNKNMNSSIQISEPKTAIRQLNKLDIIIPVYNEGDNIVEVLSLLHNNVKTPFRILICYDYENDDTLAALNKYPYRSTTAIALVKNTTSGVLGAIKSGISHSDAAAVLIFPADDTFNAQIIDSMVKCYEEGCEVVVASRMIPGGCMDGCPWVKATLVRTAAFLLYHFARLPTHDPTNGFRLFSAKVFDQFPIESQQGWCFSLELLAKCDRAGWRVAEVPARWRERTKGKSRFRLSWVNNYLKWFFYSWQTLVIPKKDRLK
jgi:dolichol-phosphate mannosyltransferase